MSPRAQTWLLRGWRLAALACAALLLHRATPPRETALTRLTLAGAIRRGELVPLLGDFYAEEPVPIHAVYPHRRHLAPKVTAFVNFLIEKFTPPPWEI